MSSWLRRINPYTHTPHYPEQYKAYEQPRQLGSETYQRLGECEPAKQEFHREAYHPAERQDLSHNLYRKGKECQWGDLSR